MKFFEKKDTSKIKKDRFIIRRLLIAVLVIGVLFYQNAISSFAVTKSITSCTITVPKSVGYTGKAIIPEVTIKDGKKDLIEGVDYILTAKKNIALGKATVTIKGKAKYKGSVTKTFSITKKKMEECEILLDKTKYVYDGTAITPGITVKNGTTIINIGRSYTVTYKNNTKIGIASVVITGKGNFTGSVTKKFQILPSDIQSLSATAKSSGTSITLNWDKISGVDGYYIYKYDSVTQKYKKISTTTSPTRTINNLTPGEEYTFGVRAYKKIGKTVLASEHYVNASKLTPVPTVTHFNSPESSYNSVHLQWDKMNKMSGYIIYTYDAATNTYKKVKTINWNTNSCVIKELTGSTDYTFAIRGYHKSVGKTYYSSNYTRLATRTERDYSSKTMYVDGDSIAYGTGAGGYSFANALSRKYGFQMTKHAVPGALLSTAYVGKGHIVESVQANFNQAYDYVLLDGGVNDYLRSMNIGTVGSKDTSTMLGGLDVILTHIRSKAPNAKVYFILPHKIYDSKTYHDTTVTKNKIGLTYTDYRNALINMLRVTSNKYNVKIIDCYSLIDASIKEEREQKTADIDGIHPSKNSQIKIYTPYIASKMGL